MLGVICGLLVTRCGSSGGESGLAHRAGAIATDSRATGWKPTTKVREYGGDSLFDYFSNGAATYREYGCRRVRVQDYVNTDGDEVRIEAFETATPAGAYGLFSLKTDPGGEIVEVGVDGWKQRYTLDFWRGNWQVTLTANKITGRSVEHLTFLAVAVDQGLEGAEDRPRMMALLPERDLLPKGRVYVAGPATLKEALGRDTWPFPPPLRGVIGSYAGIGGRYQLAILEYETPEAARDAGRRAAPKGSALNARHNRMLVVLPEPQGSFLYAYIGPKQQPEQAKLVLSVALREFRRYHE
jgi:hypothetical protein